MIRVPEPGALFAADATLLETNGASRALHITSPAKNDLIAVRYRLLVGINFRNLRSLGAFANFYPKYEEWTLAEVHQLETGTWNCRERTLSVRVQEAP